MASARNITFLTFVALAVASVVVVAYLKSGWNGVKWVGIYVGAAVLVGAVSALVEGVAKWLVSPGSRCRTRSALVCAHCGYDLRATSEIGGPRLDRCPECGKASEG